MDVYVSYGTKTTPEEAVEERDKLALMLAHPNYPAAYMRMPYHESDDIKFIGAYAKFIAQLTQYAEVAVWRQDPLDAAREAAASYPPEVKTLPPAVPQYWTFDQDIIVDLRHLTETHGVATMTIRILSLLIVPITPDVLQEFGFDANNFDLNFLAFGFMSPVEMDDAGKNYIDMQMWQPIIVAGPNEYKLTGWPFSRMSNQAEDEKESFALIISSMLDFMRSKVVERTDTPLDRAARRRYHKRTGAEPPPIRVVTLRRPKADKEDDANTEARDWSCRWLVRPHWRKQWYPSAQEHRAKLIAAYVKGPDGKPFRAKSPTKVYNVAR